MHHQKRIAVHLLVVVGAHVDLETELAHGGIDVHGHGLGGRAGHAGLFAGFAVAGAVFAKTAGVHEEHEGALEAGQEDGAFQFDEFGVDSGGPGVAVFGFVHGAVKVQDDGVGVFLEEPLAVGHRRRVGRAGAAAAVFAAAEHALHAHPLGDDDFLGVDPLIVGVVVGVKGVVDPLVLLGAQAHGAYLAWGVGFLTRFLKNYVITKGCNGFNRP